MPAKKSDTDWKRQLQELQGGTVILDAGTRSSHDNTPPDETVTRGKLLGRMEERRRQRFGGRRKRLKGLFGGGED